MTKKETQRMLKELEMMEQGKEVIRLQSPKLDEIGELMELCGVER